MLLQQPSVRRQSVRLFESPQHLVFAGARHYRQLRKRWRVKRIIGQSIAHLPHVRGWLADRCCAGVAIHEEPACLDYGFLARQDFRAGAAPPGTPVLQASEQSLQRTAENRVPDDRAGDDAAKAGLVAMTRSLAIEFGPHGIRVNAIAPGLNLTEGQREAFGMSASDGADAYPRFYQSWVKRIPLGRVGHPDDQARVVTFLVSDAAEYVTGQCLVVDGGAILV